MGDLSPALDSYLEPLRAKQKSSIQDTSADRIVLENMPPAAKLQKFGFLWLSCMTSLPFVNHSQRLSSHCSIFSVSDTICTTPITPFMNT